jgi:hypothetical protein
MLTVSGPKNESIIANNSIEISPLEVDEWCGLRTRRCRSRAPLFARILSPGEPTSGCVDTRSPIPYLLDAGRSLLTRQSLLVCMKGALRRPQACWVQHARARLTWSRWQARSRDRLSQRDPRTPAQAHGVAEPRVSRSTVAVRRLRRSGRKLAAGPERTTGVLLARSGELTGSVRASDSAKCYESLAPPSTHRASPCFRTSAGCRQ